jgi:Rrf2 family protein
VALAGADKPMTADAIARDRAVPKTYLTVILAQLRRAGLVQSRRGRIGGYTLARSPKTISLAEIVRAVDEAVDRPVDTEDDLNDTYQMLRESLVGLLDTVTVAQLLEGNVPKQVQRLAAHIHNGNASDSSGVTRKQTRLSPRAQ